jgi:hypothetical protein
MIISGPTKRQRDVIRERTGRPVSSPRATARRGHVLWSCCRSPIHRPIAIRSGLRFQRRSNRRSVSTTYQAGSSYPNTISTNGRMPVFHWFRVSQVYSAMALFHRACSHRSKLSFSNWLATVEPPGHHGYKGANDILDDEFARNNVRGLLVNSCRMLVAYRIGEYLANSAQSDCPAPGKDNGSGTAICAGCRRRRKRLQAVPDP